MVIIRILGKQYQANVGDEVVVDRISEGAKPEIEVLAVVEDKGITLGDPVLSKVKVSYKIVDQVKEDKIRVFKYKSKSRYRKTIGFTPQKTLIKIEKIA